MKRKIYIDSAQPKMMTILEAGRLYGIDKYFARFISPRWIEEEYPVKLAIEQAFRIANVKTPSLIL